MNSMISILNEAAAIWWAYIPHAAWQATLAAAVLLLAVWLGRRWPSPLRYWLLLIALAKFAMPPMLSAPMGLFSRAWPAVTPRSAAQVSPEPVRDRPSAELLSGASSTAQDTGSIAPSATVAPSREVEGRVLSPHAIAATPTEPVLGWKSWMLLAHGVGFAMVAAWVLFQLIRLWRISRKASVVSHGEFYERFMSICRRMGLRRAPRLLLSPDAMAPTAMGAVRPTVMIPSSVVQTLSPQEIGAMLAHELAHHRRWDPWINWVQVALAAVWWFNPAIWLLNRTLRKVREECCDDLVLSLEIATDSAYCETLLHAASGLAANAHVGAMLGFADRLHPLGRRIMRIMDARLRRSARLSVVGAVLIVLLASVALPGLRSGEREPSESVAPTAIAMAQLADPKSAAGNDAQASTPAAKLADNPALDNAKFNGRTIAEWIEQLISGNFQKEQEAQRELVQIGQAAVPGLLALIKNGSPKMGQAFQVLGKMGPAARDALPALLEIARDQNRPNPAGWTWNVSVRVVLLNALREMGWAAKDLIPVIQKVAENAGEKDEIRAAAVRALAGMGNDAAPLLERYSAAADKAVRDPARNALADLVIKEGKETGEQYWTRVIEQDMFDPQVLVNLSHIRGRVNSGQTFPLREKVKAAYRERLRQKPDPQLAWTLAAIIQDQLLGTQVQWAAPNDGGTVWWRRESPSESFVTMAEVLELGFACAEKGSELWRKFGIALAKLRLLQGDWSGMNAALTKIGHTTIPDEDRPWLPAPPTNWTQDVRSEWGWADASVRSGNCSLVVEVQKDGRGLAGAHVLVKEAPKIERGFFRTGWRADTLFYAPYPLDTRTGSFGYMGNDRPKTRYLVSDDSGQVRFDKLPQIPVKLEVLVPTGNFPEAGRTWDLWMETEPGQFKHASVQPGPDTVRANEAPAVVQLQEGKTVRYPLLVVHPQFGFNIEDWTAVDKDKLVLISQGFDPPPDQKIRYELEMILTAPCESPNLVGTMPIIRSTKETVVGNSWPAGEKGVGGMKLEPGNIYMFQANARDESGKVVAQWGKTRVWVPWGDRETKPPVVEMSGSSALPIHHNMYFRTVREVNGVKEDSMQGADRWLRENPSAFERNYVRVGKAWLDWHDGKVPQARAELVGLCKELPKGNVALATALQLIEQIDTGEKLPNRLKFISLADLDPTLTKELLDGMGVRW